MRLILKKVEINHFKGIRNQVIEFKDGTNTICGQNGCGKTSIPTAFLWVWSDKDYDLNSNPNIRPDDAEDGITPTVTIEAEIDGKPLTVQKSQKFKRSKPDADGVTKTSTTNAYELNSVELSARDFEKRLSEEYGIDFEKFLQLCHPNVFVSGMKDKKSRDEMRSTLFAMADGVSDLEIAKSDEKLSDVASLLESYRLDEIEAMQKASIRKIGEAYGKDGEIIDAEIRGLEGAKSDVSSDELEKQKSNLESKISDIEAHISSGEADISGIQARISTLKADISDFEREAKEKVQEELNDLKSKIFTVTQTESGMRIEVDFKKGNLDQKKKMQETALEDAKAIKVKFDEAKARTFPEDEWQFDEGDTVCKMCGQTLPDDKIAELKAEFGERKAKAKAEFEEKRQNDIEALKTQGNEKNERYIGLGKEIEAMSKGIVILEEESDKAKKERESLEKLLSETEKKLNAIDLSDNAEYQQKLSDLNDAIAELEKTRKNPSDTSSLKAEKDKLQEDLKSVVEQIGQVKNNSNIDEKVKELRQKRIDLEQQKANAEKILYKLSILSMKKNTALEEQVNKHFSIVKWKLFDVQKNGEVKDACIPYIDGFRFGQSTNTGRELLAKIDIIRGLQTFYDMHLPVFVDGAECLSENTVKRIEMDCQNIFLMVSEDEQLRFM